MKFSLHILFMVLGALVFSFHAGAQVLAENELIGEWICVEAQLEPSEPMPEGMEEKTQRITQGFIGSNFIFQPDRIFRIRFSSGHPQELFDLSFLDKQVWQYSPEKNTVLIGGRENLMSIILVKRDSHIFFYLDETPLILRMEKSK